MIHQTAKLSEQVNRKCPPRNTTVQLSNPYTDLEPSKSSPHHFQRADHVIFIYIIFSRSIFSTQYDRLSHQQVHGLLVEVETLWKYDVDDDDDKT